MENRAVKSQTRSLDVQPSSEEPGITSDESPGSALEGATKPAALCTTAPQPCSDFSEPSSDSLLEAACAGSQQKGHESICYKPLYISYTVRNPCATANLNSSAGPARSSIPASRSDLGHESVPDTSCCPGSVPACGTGPGPELSSGTPQRFRNLQPDCPNYNFWSHHCQWEPRKQLWEPLQVPEPGVRGLGKPIQVEEKFPFLCEALPRGHCLLNNWEEERATNHLDQVPSLQDGSESFFFRHGHQGLLTMQLQSPMSSNTIHKDSYQPPRNICQPLQGKREAMRQMLLHQQICREVQAEQEPTRKLFEVESMTHHDYQVQLVQAGPPAPTKPHDYRQEQPETFWMQRASQLPGVSNIRTLDTPFRKNCSFSTPVPLSMGQPLPYEPDNFPNQMGKMSSLACQGGRQGCQAGGTTLA